MTFRTVTFNMQNGQPWEETVPDKAQINLERTVDFLNEQEADVIFLQEVEQGFDGGLQLDPPPNYTFLKKHIKGYDSVFAYPVANASEIPFGLGLAIFSKSKLRDFQRINLPAPDVEFEFSGALRKPSQRLLISSATVIQGREIHLLNAHLQAFFMIESSSADHPAQRNAVEAALRAQTGPAILAGDMNCVPEEGLLEQFQRAGFQTAQNREVTWRRQPYVLDHLFYNPPLRLESCAVIPTTASDHHAVRADFSFV
ncbi:MAG: endonuclease/exonuclease/phosphatase family protein [Chthoniobacterales bacterium]|nr:endonuclease/exonuclease/phosphatase family protein [Chthoniobacterales bacterium]